MKRFSKLTAERAILRAAELLDIDLDSHTAQTGSIYLSGWVGDDYVTIRVADHGECYCHEIFSVDPTGWTVRAAIEWMAEQVGKPVPASIQRGWRAAETRAANRAKNEADTKAAIESHVARSLAGNSDVAIDRFGVWRANVPAGTENRKQRIAAAREAIHAAYTAAWESLRK